MVHFPSRTVWKRTAAISIIAATVSISISTCVRMLSDVEPDNVTIAIQLTLPFVIATPLALYWCTKLDKLEQAYRVLTTQANELASSASTDPLTGLLNRRYFIAQFEQAMVLRVPGWFLIADIDYLKTINDTYGHPTGDEAVLATAKALKTALPKDSLLARIGGDEFCAFIPSAQENEVLALNERVTAFASKLFNENVKADGMELSVTLGKIACKPNHTFAEVINKADERLYRKKRSRHYVRGDIDEPINEDKRGVSPR